MATTFRRIDTLEEALPLSEAGLLWYRYATTSTKWAPDPVVGYWAKHAHMWEDEYSANIQYAILLEE